MEKKWFYLCMICWLGKNKEHSFNCSYTFFLSENEAEEYILEKCKYSKKTDIQSLEELTPDGGKIKREDLIDRVFAKKT